MANFDEDRFRHRNNKDGSFDSICTRCFLTVGSADEEGQLCCHEDSHKCSPVRPFAVVTGATVSMD